MDSGSWLMVLRPCSACAPSGNTRPLSQGWTAGLLANGTRASVGSSRPFSFNDTQAEHESRLDSKGIVHPGAIHTPARPCPAHLVLTATTPHVQSSSGYQSLLHVRFLTTRSLSPQNNPVRFLTHLSNGETVARHHAQIHSPPSCQAQVPPMSASATLMPSFFPIYTYCFFFF